MLAKNMDREELATGYKELTPFEYDSKATPGYCKSSNMRQEFTANVSHELKTPLTSISGYSELIAGEWQREKMWCVLPGKSRKIRRVF